MGCVSGFVVKLKGYLYRKFWGDKEMFGRKKKEDKEKELEALKAQISQKGMQPAYPQQFQPIGQPVQTAPSPVSGEISTPYFIGERVRIERQKQIVSGTGQIIDSPEKEIVDTLNVIHQLTVDDLIDLSKGLISKTSLLSQKAKTLIEQKFKR